jgi:pyruvate dehydrogenase E2 component (dihydrolipoamide acetyltransferase)
MGTPAPTPISTSAASLKGDITIEEPNRAERAIARHSAETRATVPDLELSVDVDAGPLLERARDQGCSTTAVLIGACAAALRQFPRVNAAYRDGRYQLYSRVNVSVTMHSRDAPQTATLLDADTKSLAELDQELDRLVQRGRAGELTPPEQAGATFTLSDLGPYGIHRAGALVTPPQAGALTAGAIHAVARVRDGVLAPGYELALTLACDHRIVFPAHGAAFLARIAEQLEGPGKPGKLG